MNPSIRWTPASSIRIRRLRRSSSSTRHCIRRISRHRIWRSSRRAANLPALWCSRMNLKQAAKKPERNSRRSCSPPCSKSRLVLPSAKCSPRKAAIHSMIRWLVSTQSNPALRSVNRRSIPSRIRKPPPSDRWNRNPGSTLRSLTSSFSPSAMVFPKPPLQNGLSRRRSAPADSCTAEHRQLRPFLPRQVKRLPPGPRRSRLHRRSSAALAERFSQNHSIRAVRLPTM